MTKYLLAISLILSNLIAFSQNNSEKPKGQIAGEIIDKVSQEPILYATIALYSAKDSTLISGTLTGEGGRFEITEIPFGRYYLSIKFIGYEKLNTQKFQINFENLGINLGKIELQQSYTQIDGVEIVAERTYVEYKIDKKVVNVGKDLNAAGGTAVDALENVPSVTVDVDGNVALRGSSSFTVFVNGKPTPLSGTDALNQIPVGAIKNIEIITNPSAKYDPDGLSGIINVVLKENVKLGLNGMIDVTASNRGTYGINGVLSYNIGKFNLFVGGNYSNNQRPGEGFGELITENGDTNLYRITDLEQNRARYNRNLRAGFDFTPNKKNSISVEGTFGNSGHNKDFTSYIHEYDNPNSYNQYYLSQNPGTSADRYFNFTTNYEYKLDNVGSNIQALFYYENENGNNEDKSEEFFSNANYIETDSIMRGIITRELEKGPQYRAKIDLTKKLKNNKKFETGLQLIARPQYHEYEFEEYQADKGWVLLPDYGSQLNFNQNVFAAYGIYAGEYKAIGYQIGLRGEQTYRNVFDEFRDYSFKINRFDLFPTVHLSRKMKANQQMLLSYSRRVDRPGGWELEPFTRYISSNYKRKGNPELEPEFTNNFEISYQKSFNNSYFSIEGYHRETYNKISRIQQVDTDNVILMTFVNMDKDYSTGVELMLNLRLIKWMDINISGNYYRYQLVGNNTVLGDINNTSNNYNLRGNINFIATKTTRIQINGFYGSPTVTAQGESASNYMISASLRQDLFKKKMSISLRVNDIFNTMRHEFTTYGTGFTNTNSFTGMNPTITLNVSYKINNYKEKKSLNGGDSRESGDGIM